MTEPQVDLLQIKKKPTGDILIIGDVHGEFGAFSQVVAQIKPDDILIIAGDLIDRGQDSNGKPTTTNVLDKIIDVNKESMLAGLGPKIYAIKGNHEELFLNAMAEIQDGAGTGDATRGFLHNGGDWIFADEQTRKNCLAVIATFRLIENPTDEEIEKYCSDMEEYFHIIKIAYRSQYIDKAETGQDKLIKKLDIYQEYINDLPSIIKVNDIDPLLVGHSQIALTDRAIDEKIKSNQLALTAQEKYSLFWTRPDKFSTVYRNLNSIPVFCGHNILSLDDNDEFEEIAPVRSDTNHINLDGGAYFTKNFLLVNFTQKSATIIPASDTEVHKKLEVHASAIQRHLKGVPFARLTSAINIANTADAIDIALISFIAKKDHKKEMNIKEQKQMYLNALTHLCDPKNPKITPELQQQLAHHVLKNPSHLLKQERDLFRFSHSNETDSMHQMI